MSTLDIPGYAISRPIDTGGMATVYLAVQKSLSRQVAIKVMDECLNKDQNFIERFEQEAKIASRLSHPNIVTIFDYGSINTPNKDVLYLVMAYIDGQDLKALQPKLSLVTRLKIIQDIAHALSYAHQHGVIHRDIKPQNILIQKENHRALLTDFGIAKANKGSQELTQTGMTLGTPHYMSPEQALGKPIDHRTDIYSLGVVLYFLLTGHVPYKGDSDIEVGIKHCNEPIPSLPKIYQCFQNTINHALAKSPDDRYQTAEEFAEEVGKISIANLATLVHSINNESEAVTTISTTSTIKQASKKHGTLDNIKTILMSTTVTAGLLLLVFWLAQEYYPNQNASNPSKLTPEKSHLKQNHLDQQGKQLDAHTSNIEKITPEKLTCRYEVLESWRNGWQGRILLTNTSNQLTKDWSVSFSLPKNSSITNSFVTKIQQDGKNTLLHPHDWNQQIQSQKTLNVDFQGSGATPSQLDNLRCSN